MSWTLWWGLGKQRIVSTYKEFTAQKLLTFRKENKKQKNLRNSKELTSFQRMTFVFLLDLGGLSLAFVRQDLCY